MEFNFGLNEDEEEMLRQAIAMSLAEEGERKNKSKEENNESK